MAGDFARRSRAALEQRRCYRALSGNVNWAAARPRRVARDGVAGPNWQEAFSLMRMQRRNKDFARLWPHGLKEPHVSPAEYIAFESTDYRRTCGRHSLDRLLSGCLLQTRL